MKWSRELETTGNRISFDAELAFNKTIEQLEIKNFKELFKDKTEEELSKEVLKKQDILKTEQCHFFLTMH